jgi:hypothetical protein
VLELTLHGHSTHAICIVPEGLTVVGLPTSLKARFSEPLRSHSV